ncbi:MAG: hypothetical protein EXS43_01675 [Opitutus sp.]|jgi:hypothetical protein|nr:hypothetical protein [Opitutus sp.]
MDKKGVGEPGGGLTRPWRIGFRFNKSGAHGFTNPNRRKTGGGGGVHPADEEERFVRGTGPGGQKIKIFKSISTVSFPTPVIHR